MDREAFIAQIQEQERALLFDRFHNQDAWEIGERLARRGRAEGKAITIHISLNRHLLFHCALEGTSPNNENWITGKENVVYHFFQSSQLLELSLQAKGRALADYGLDPALYKASGGGFPIKLRGAGVVGAIVVSGMAGHEDHGWVVEAIREQLAKA